MSAEDEAGVESSRGHISRTFDLWESSVIPTTLVHGDLHGSNIALSNGPESPFIFFDRESGFSGYPFFDLRDPAWHPLYKREARRRSWNVGQSIRVLVLL